MKLGNLGTLARLSQSTVAKPLPELNGVEGVQSFYLRNDVKELQMTTSGGIVGDNRLLVSHQIRERDVLIADPALLAAVSTKGAEADIGQNITLSENDSVANWCIGDEIKIGDSAIIRITSCRKPCPKNDNVHGSGTYKKMLLNAIGGIFGEVIADGTIRPGDTLKLIKRRQSNWSCIAVHMALYGPNCNNTNMPQLRDISTLDYLEGPRYKDIALERYDEQRKTKMTTKRYKRFENFISAAAFVIIPILLVCYICMQLFYMYVKKDIHT